MKLINYIIIFSLLVSFTSCEALIEETTYKKTAADFFKTEADAQSAITAVYAQFEGYDYFGQYYWMALEAAGGGITSSRVTGESGAIFLKENISTNQMTTHLWQIMYISVAYANNVIENVPQMTINQAVKNSIYGQALYLRAMQYFNLVRMWGAVPIRLSATKGLGEMNGRAPESVVYKQIIDDLMLASNLLPKTQSLKGAATKGAAYGLLAKVYLTAASMKKHSGNTGGNFDFVPEQAYYDSARLYCQRVTDLGVYKLVDDYMKQFPIQFAPNRTVTPAGFENSSESIFEIQFVNGSLRMGSGLPMQIMPTPRQRWENGKVVSTLPDGTLAPATCGSGYTYNDAGWGEFRVTKTFFDDFLLAHRDTTNKQDDYRMDITFLGGPKGIVVSYKKGVLQTKVGDTLFVYPYNPRPAVDIAQRWPYLGKYQDYNGTATTQHGSNFIYLRYADVLLMQAEAENELNDNVSATTHLNMIMARARKADGTPRLTPYDYSSGLSQDSLRKAIWNERGFELFGEAHFWFDQVRTGQYIKFLEHYNSYEYIVRPEREVPMAIDKRNMLFPIPYLEISRNDKITQNPGHI